MNIIGIIPSRYNSTRFPGKPLIDIKGKSMIQRVYEQATKSTELSEVYVATDDTRIEQHVKGFGGNVIMTSTSHQSGTDRCLEAISLIHRTPDVIVNIQGDEPFINPDQIDLIASLFNSPSTQIATLATPIGTTLDLFNPNITKVILDKESEAIYFSKHAIPFIRNINREEWINHYTFLKHIGIYAYTPKALVEITSLEQSSLELLEGLEQLRWVENKYRIKTTITPHDSISVDTPDDLKNFSQVYS
jgi:3-deoxy-manno-octulosonate cytidylyltransferase (CMP-KDO synthetase)